MFLQLMLMGVLNGLYDTISYVLRLVILLLFSPKLRYYDIFEQ